MCCFGSEKQNIKEKQMKKKGGKGWDNLPPIVAEKGNDMFQRKKIYKYMQFIFHKRR